MSLRYLAESRIMSIRIQTLMYSLNKNNDVHRSFSNNSYNDKKSILMLSKNREVLKDEMKNRMIVSRNFYERYPTKHFIRTITTHKNEEHMLSPHNTTNSNIINSKDSSDDSNTIKIHVDQSEICHAICNGSTEKYSQKPVKASNDGEYCHLCKSAPCSLLPAVSNSDDKKMKQNNVKETETVEILLDKSEIVSLICNQSDVCKPLNVELTLDTKDIPKDGGYCSLCDAAKCKYDTRKKSVSTENGNVDKIRDKTESSSEITTNDSDMVKIVVDKSDVCRYICNATDELIKGSKCKTSAGTKDVSSKETTALSKKTDLPVPKTTVTSEQNKVISKEISKEASFCYECNAPICKMVNRKKSVGFNGNKKAKNATKSQRNRKSKVINEECLRSKCQCRECKLLRQKD